MRHLLLCREFPPAPYPPGGIGTYVSHMARLLAEAGETVHVIAQRWQGASGQETVACGGKLIVHRISLREPAASKTLSRIPEARLLREMEASECPSQVFSWQAARVAERLIESGQVDLIEAPEWEAPIYYLQLRRALGLGPQRQPPCLVHLHSPSALIFEHNQWDRSLTDFLPLCRLEEHGIRSADALICPSRYLGAEAERLFGLPSGRISVIPYPAGDTPVIERAPEVWARNTVCYVGRLELRKGVVEWLDAAIAVARTHAGVTFEFIGSDTSLSGGLGTSVRRYLLRRIPRELRERFVFRDSLTREKLLQRLAEIPLVAVPSQWDNLPYTCIEAMATGIPVLASPNGGMAELIADGRSGWIAPAADAPALAAALRRFLNTPPVERARMGRAAAGAVRRICGNETVVQRHLELRSRIVEAGVGQSLRIPAGVAAEPPQARRQGIGVVVTCLRHPKRLRGCLDSLARQTLPAHETVLVLAESYRHTATAIEGLDSSRVVYTCETSLETAREAGARQLLSLAPQLRAIIFLGENARLEPDCVRVSESVFEKQPEVGVLAFFILDGSSGNRIEGITPLTAGAGDPVAELPCLAVRAERFPPGGPALPVAWTSPRWAAVTYPDLLVSMYRPLGRTERRGRRVRRYSAMALAQRSSTRTALRWFMAAPLGEKLTWLGRVLMRRRHTVRRLVGEIVRFARKAQPHRKDEDAAIRFAPGQH